MTGLPCSGKSYRSQQIADDVSHRISEDSANSKRTVQVIDSKHAHSDASNTSQPVVDGLRDQIYTIAAQEKTARAEEYSAIKRAVSKDNVVVADGLNYIKGYRYQFWCEAKAASTRCCVVHVAAQEGECRRWNEERLWACGREIEIGEPIAPSGEQPVRQGKDVVGELMPESHTAIYGDRVAEPESRSRSSSVDVVEDGDRPQPEDTMTLKSLYILDNNNDDSAKHTPSLNRHEAPSPQSQTLPTTPIPSPSSAQPYLPSTLTSLIMRYEPPSPFSRWDTPLFTIPTSDAHPPYSDIWAALFPPPSKPTSRKALSQLPRQQPSDLSTRETQAPRPNKPDQVRQHAATQLPPATSSSALQTLESTTLEIVKLVLAAARTQGAADGDGGSVSLSLSLPLPGRTNIASQTQIQKDDEDDNAPFETQLHIPTGTVLSQPLLQRLRRKYTQIQRAAIAHGREYAGMRDGRAGVVVGFLGFVGAELEGD